MIAYLHNTHAVLAQSRIFPFDEVYMRSDVPKDGCLRTGHITLLL
jgi:hypothetical protein